MANAKQVSNARSFSVFECDAMNHRQCASKSNNVRNINQNSNNRTMTNVNRVVPNSFLMSLCLFILLAGSVSCVEDYCSKNTFVTNSTHLQLTKEVTSIEYGVIGNYKSLHCCAKGYRSIEWYKDERAHPWPREVSTFILYPEAANQTIYTGLVSDSDKGNYTCLMRNDTHMQVHTIMLVVVEKPPPAPRATFTPEDQWVELGQPARLYCEAFVGRVNLPDASNDVMWTRVRPEGKPKKPTGLNQEKVVREEEQTIGAYLNIPAMKSEDYGEYLCTVSNADSFIEMSIWLHHKVTEPGVQSNQVPWRVLCLVAVGVILSMLTAGVMYAKFGLNLVLRWRHTTASRNLDNKEYDVLVLYTAIDAPLTFEVFIPTLQNVYSYKCINCQVPQDPAIWPQVVGSLASMSRSVIAIISPNEMTSAVLTSALIMLHKISHDPKVVLLQGYDKLQSTPKNADGENLHSMLRKTRLIPWRKLEDKNFWALLQLSLPPPYSMMYFIDRTKLESSNQRLSIIMETRAPEDRLERQNSSEKMVKYYDNASV